MNETNGNLDVRDSEELSRAVALAQHTVYKKYLYELSDYDAVEPPPSLLDENARENLMLFRLDELACKKGEDPFQKLSTVYHASMSLGCSLFVLIDTPRPGGPADVYLGVRDGRTEKSSLITSFKALKNGLLGNFPGTRLHKLESTEEAPRLLEDIFDNAYTQYVTSVSCVASLRDKSMTEEKGFVQGLERFLDTMRGNAYTALLLAEPVTAGEQLSIRRGFEELYATLSPFRKSSWSYNETESSSVMESLCAGLSASVTSSTAHTQGHAFNVGLNAGVTLKKIFNIGLSGGYSKSVSDTVSRSFACTASENRTRGETTGSASGRTLQVEHDNKPIEEMLDRIEEQLKRVRQGEDYGSYSCGAYFLSDKQDSTLLAANTYRALLLGEGSSVESGAIHIWDGARDGAKVARIKEYLKRCVHPLFSSPAGEEVIPYTAGVTVSGLELPLHLGLPTRSVYGLPVLEYAEFGRNVRTRSPEEDRREINLGSVFHMGRTESAPVALDVGELTAHTFITGSTGTGKTNTVCRLLDKLCFQGEAPAKFLVIEPAKGEYKNQFGGREGVSVYGTNPKKTALLRLNPFSFPEDIHVLEHIDRLVEVFNACWPMYAAMPAVLKDAVESAYVSCGWNLTRSACAFSPARVPTFATLLRRLPEILEGSAYSPDTKGDYAGALVTRVKSLTNGINGQIFCAEDALSDRELFDENVIVDLSRVGSPETKALLMGILMIKLQEYRIAAAEGSDAALRHVTVLEEAHNLLRRTSPEQSQETANLQGKSVEMLSNAIAEMRAYGEGFLIADQAPGLLDTAVIRNTNTKIILRLPDESDRQLVGKAAGLNDGQIMELARLDTGVAAVFQSRWLEPVLCRVERFHGGAAYRPENLPPPEETASMDGLFRRVLRSGGDREELTEEQADRVRRWMDRLDTGRGAKELLLRAAGGEEPLTENEKGYLLYCLVRGRALIRQAEERMLPSDVQAAADQRIMEILQVSAGLAEEIRRLVFQYAAEQVREDESRYGDLRYYGGVEP